MYTYSVSDRWFTSVHPEILTKFALFFWIWSLSLFTAVSHPTAKTFANDICQSRFLPRCCFFQLKSSQHCRLFVWAQFHSRLLGQIPENRFFGFSNRVFGFLNRVSGFLNRVFGVFKSSFWIFRWSFLV